MSINCDIVLSWNAKPEQLRALGVALWRWYDRTAGSARIYDRLDNQALADLIAGQFPRFSRSERGGACLRVRDADSQDRQAAISGLRQAIPADEVEDIMVEGKSWNLID